MIDISCHAPRHCGVQNPRKEKNQLILINFSYSTPVRNSKYLAIPPNPLPLRNIKMAPNVN